MKNFIIYASFALLFISCKGSSENDRNSNILGGTLIVSHKTDNTIHLISRATGETLKVLNTGVEPHEVEVSDDGRFVVVCNYGNREIAGNTLSVFDVENASLLKTIVLGEHARPHGMQWIKGTQKMLVTAESTNNLLLIDVEKGSIERTMNTDQPVSHMVAASIDYSKAFVPSIRTGNVTVIDLSTDSIIAQVYSGEGAEGAAVSPNGDELWVTNRAENTISVFNTKTFEMISRIDCGDFPIRIKFSPNGNKVLVSNAQSAEVAIIDASKKEVLAKVKLTVPLPTENNEDRFFANEFKDSSIPIGLVVPDNQWAYVANTNADLVSEININTFEITRHFKTGKQPDGTGFSPLVPKITE